MNIPLEDSLIKNWEFTLNAVEDWICVMKPDLKIVRSNKAVEKLFNIPVQKVIGETCSTLLHGTDTPVKGCPLTRVIRTRKRESARIKTSDNRWMMITVDPVFNSDGQINGVVLIARDIKQKSGFIQKSVTNLLPICSVCKKIRDQKGNWNLLENHLKHWCNISFSHGICPDCRDKIYGHESWYQNLKKKE